MYKVVKMSFFDSSMSTALLYCTLTTEYKGIKWAHYCCEMRLLGGAV